jgi:hypothetical protein
MIASLAMPHLSAEALRITIVCLVAAFLIVQYFRARFHQRRPDNQLANTTILIVRHSEKPASGRVLNQQGRTRAHAYAHYFAPFQHANQTLSIDTLIAGADSKRSIRPRLTLEPLSHATGLPIDATFSTNDTPALAKSLRKTSHGKAILICWRHNQIPILLDALGANTSQLLPNSKWPTEIYDWVILLRYNAQGELATQQRIQQPDLFLVYGGSRGLQASE